MSEHASKQVCLEPTEVQKLRLRSAQLACELNFADRGQMEADQRFYQLTKNVAEAALKQIEAELARLERGGSLLVRELFEVSEQIKAENKWPQAVTWDPVTLKFSAPAEAMTQSVRSDDHILSIH